VAAPEQQAGRSWKAHPDRAEGTGGFVDLDRWWLERRLLAQLLTSTTQAAYNIAERRPPDARVPRGRTFHAGWVALRYLHNPKAAAQHFARIVDGTHNPHALSRGGYWQGRAAEAMGQNAQAKAFYEMAGQHIATYYGQLARARLGLKDVGLRAPPAFTPQEMNVLNNLEAVRAAAILYELGERDMLASIYAELGESATDIAGMAMMGELAAKHGDGRAMLLLGSCLPPRLPLEHYAYPTVGLPDYSRSPQLSLRSPIRSRARKVTLIKRSSQAPTRWA
jgi:soluble lytic murein transglycosylase